MALLVASNVALLVAVVVLAVITLSVARQVGVLHERTAPVGDWLQANVVAVGDAVPLESYLPGKTLTKPLLVCLFVAVRCPLCKALNAHFRSIVDARDRELDGLWVLAERSSAVDGYVESQNLPAEAVVTSPELAAALSVTQTPALVGIDGDGRLVERVLVAQRQDLERHIDRWLAGER